MEFGALLGLFGPLSIAITLAVMGLISRRLGEQTYAKPFYLGFYAAALLMLVSVAAQFLDLLLQGGSGDPLWIILVDVLPAVAVTIGVIFAWRYWSWLLAERD